MTFFTLRRQVHGKSNSSFHPTKINKERIRRRFNCMSRKDNSIMLPPLEMFRLLFASLEHFLRFIQRKEKSVGVIEDLWRKYKFSYLLCVLVKGMLKRRIRR
ncbi:hypothetical protein ACFFRR_010825 [Megaselia abdita]